MLIVGQDPYPTPGHAGRPVVLGRPRRAARAAQPANIYRELSTDLGLPAPPHRRPVAVGRPGRAAAQPGAHRAARAPRPATAARAGRPSPAGAIAALVERGGPLVAILWGRDAQTLGPAPRRRRRASRSRTPRRCRRTRRLLRVAAVQPRQRPAARAGRRPRSTGASRDHLARPAARAGPGAATSRSATPSPRACATRTPPAPDRFVGWADRLAAHLAVAERPQRLRLRQPRGARAAARRHRRAGSSTPRWRWGPTW